MELERLDGSDPESAVRIEGDAGEVFLGRGPLLRITEVGMSRKHAKIHFEAGKWTLTALQNKPCYVQKPGEKLYTPLEKDREQLLDDGCKVSLLENKFTYKIIIPMQDSKGEKSKLEPVATKGDLSGKKRSLPAWMMKVASKNAKESPSKPPQVAATTKKKETKAQTTSTSPKKTPSPPAPRSPPKKKKKFDTSYESEPEDPERTPKKKGGTHCLSDQEEENEETTPPPKYSRKTHDLSDADDEDELTPVKNNVSPKKRSSPPSSSVKKRSSPLKPVDAAAIRSRHALSDEDESDEEEDIKEAKKPEKASSPPKRTPKKAVKKLSAMSDSEGNENLT